LLLKGINYFLVATYFILYFSKNKCFWKPIWNDDPKSPIGPKIRRESCYWQRLDIHRSN
jgi:hypothetical protein